MKTNKISDEQAIGFIVMGIALIILTPCVLIWATNVIFNVNIPLNFTNWCIIHLIFTVVKCIVASIKAIIM